MSRLYFGGWLAAFILLGASPQLSAQAPGAAAAAPPAASAVGAPGGAGAAGAAGEAAGAVKPGFLEKICTRCMKCRRRLCATPAGALLNNITKPLTGLTGGVIPPFCPIIPSLEDLAKPGVAGAAAEGKKDAAEAKARQMDVRYLGTLDCRYYPNAAIGLANALRTDPSECVRFEAAQALSRGCCCNKVTLLALEASVSGTDLDGNPAERSVRVRCTAALALERCLACYVAPVEEAPAVEIPKGQEVPKGEGPPAPGMMTEKNKESEKEKDKDAKPALANNPTPAAIARARKTLAAFQELYTNTLHPAPAPGTGPDQSVFSILKFTSPDPMPRPVMLATHTEAIPTIAPSAKPGATAAEAPAAMPSVALKPIAASPADNRLPEPDAKSQAVVPGTMPQSAKPAEADAKPTAAVTPVHFDGAADGEGAAGEVLNGAKRLLLSDTEVEKHAAVRTLVKFDWMEHPRVASALLAGTAADQPAAVRVDCIRHLAHHGMGHPKVLADLQTLSGDSDAWVKEEAVKALAKMK